MKNKDITKLFEKWINPKISWENDPSGLLVGDADEIVHNIIVSLNITKEVVNEAIEKKCSLIVSHHPLFYRPIHRLVKGEYYSDIIMEMVENNISHIAYHTPLDLVKGGTSFSLATALGLKNQKNLVGLNDLVGVEKSRAYKFAVYTPSSHVNQLKNAISEAGGAVIGNYDYCFFQNEGKGFFRPGKKTSPYIGKYDKITSADEIKLEFVVEDRFLVEVKNSIKANHPYEEPAIDIYSIDLDNRLYGGGVIGEIDPITLDDFTEFVKMKLKTDSIRIAYNGKKKNIKKVAVWGGSGSDFWEYAYNQDADVYLSSDFTHHSYLEAFDKIAIMDVSHHSSEQFAAISLFEYLEQNVTDKEIKLYLSKNDRDPIK